jgi:hypothetical protein
MHHWPVFSFFLSLGIMATTTAAILCNKKKDEVTTLQSNTATKRCQQYHEQREKGDPFTVQQVCSAKARTRTHRGKKQQCSFSLFFSRFERLSVFLLHSLSCHCWKEKFHEAKRRGGRTK